MSHDKRTENIKHQYELLSFAVKHLTQDWTEEERSHFSKFCFNEVANNRYERIGRFPVMNISIRRQ